MSQLKFRDAALTVVACGLFAGLACAQSSSPTRQDLLAFDNFLDSHPAIEKDLRGDPSLVNSATYLSAHPELKQFLTANPTVSQDLAKDAKGVMNREAAFDRKGRDLTKAEVKAFDDFLDQHKAIDKDLSKHPALVNDPNYLAKHPELQAFLNSNPQIKQDLAEHPRAFMKAERRFDAREAKAAKADLHEQRAEHRQEVRIEAPHPAGGKH
jgi:hypothetical protein